MFQINFNDITMIKEIIFVIDVLFLYILLIGIIWSILVPNKRIWPPPKKNSWQQILTWFLFYAIFLLNFLLFFLDYDTWILKNPLRFLIAIPLIIIGTIIFYWGYKTLGSKNTSGVKNGFIENGIYHFTRNPQYLGDNILFLGIMIFFNSTLLLITHFLLILVFILTPWAEEVWLEEQYGEEYINFKIRVPRFL